MMLMIRTQWSHELHTGSMMLMMQPFGAMCRIQENLAEHLAGQMMLMMRTR